MRILRLEPFSLPAWLLSILLIGFLGHAQGQSSSLAWTQTYKGPYTNGADSARVVAVDGAGDVVVTGSSQFSNLGSEIYTAKYSGVDGHLLWERRSKGGAGGV